MPVGLVHSRTIRPKGKNSDQDTRDAAAFFCAIVASFRALLARCILVPSALFRTGLAKLATELANWYREFGPPAHGARGRPAEIRAIGAHLGTIRPLSQASIAVMLTQLSTGSTGVNAGLESTHGHGTFPPACS